MLKSVLIQDKLLEVPIIQGGMGVGVSLSNLAGNVMANGAMGVLSAAHPGYRDLNFRQDSVSCNVKAIFEETKKARIIAKGKGLLAVNIMVASKDYAHYVKAAIDAKIDAIISGAGLPLELPALAKGSTILLAPIVSSGKAMKLILKMWDIRHQTTPDFVVVEGSDAGGHLGFKKEDLLTDSCDPLDKILSDVKQELASYEVKYNKNIPVFVAGGIFTGQDIAKYIRLGAVGVQMGTRFIATHECDASDTFKAAVINSTKETIEIVQSPTGFPGRGIMNDFMKENKVRGNIKVSKCLNCLIPCTPLDTPYCISEALIQSVQGNLDKGLIFVGSNAYRLEKLQSVSSLIQELVDEATKVLED